MSVEPASELRRAGAVSELAQVTVARLRAPLDDPAMAGFTGALDAVHRLAEASPGFVWRLAARDDRGHGIYVVHVPRAGAGGGGAAGAGESQLGPAFLNVSVWTGYAALHRFVYRSRHGAFVRQRARWFHPADGPSTALWWVPPGVRPSAEEGVRRLAHLRAHGPTWRAFSLRRRFGPDGAPERRSGAG